MKIPRRIVLDALRPTVRFTTIELGPPNPLTEILVSFLRDVDNDGGSTFPNGDVIGDQHVG